MEIVCEVEIFEDSVFGAVFFGVQLQASPNPHFTYDKFEG